MKNYNKKNYVGELIKIFPAFVFIFCIFRTVSANVNPIPDFAFPKRVETQSDSILKAALKNGDEAAALRSALNLCIARNELTSAESVSANYELIGSITPKLSEEYKSLAQLIQAEILTQEYLRNSYIYDDRNLPLDIEWPEDPRQWSAEMYKTRIYSLTDSATLNVRKYPDTGISHIASILSDYEGAEEIKMTVRDFIAFKGERLLKNFVKDGESTIIPFYPESPSVEQSIENLCLKKIKAILGWLISTNEADNSEITSLAMIDFASVLPEAEKEKYLQDCKSRIRGSEGEGNILYSLWTRQRNENNRDLYNDIKEWLSKYPSGISTSQLKYIESLMAQKKMEISTPGVVLPGEKFKLTATLNNLSHGYVLIYRLADNEYDKYDRLILKNFAGSGTPAQLFEIEQGGEVPFQNIKTIEIPGLTEGVYIAIPSTERKLPKGWNKSSEGTSYSTFRVSNISILTSFDSNQENSGRIYVVNSRNQAPVKGAKVSYYSGDSNKPKGSAVTNADGWVSVPQGYYRIEARQGKNIAKRDAGFSYYPTKFQKEFHASILTDLSVYRPGDTVRFAVVGWVMDSIGNYVNKDSDIKITMRDANFIKLGEKSLHLDMLGRASGEFVIPERSLLGTYRLVAEYTGINKNNAGSIDFEVAEYKLPGFIVDLNQEKSEKDSEIRIKGKAATYSGMAIGNVPVKITVKYIAWNPWKWNTAHASYHQTVNTGSDGVFSLTLPVGNLKGTSFEKGRYSVTAEVTSESGETVNSNPIYFYLGNAHTMSPQIKEKTEIQGGTIEMYVPVYDMAGLPEKTVVEYKFTNLFKSDDVVTGSFISPNLSVNSSRIVSGKYKLEFNIRGENDPVVTETVFWRDNDSKAPYPTSLWIPENQYTYSHGQREVKVKFGSYWKDYIMYILSDEKGILEQKWIYPEDRLVTLPVNLPGDACGTYFISLSGMHDLKAENEKITIVPTKSLENMTVETESFRENITAGTVENWKFRFKVDNLPAQNISALAVMSDKALNSIKDFKWNLNIRERSTYTKVHLGLPYTGENITYRSFSQIGKYPQIINYIPDWQTYGYPLVSSGFIRGGGTVMYKSMATRELSYDSASVITNAAAKPESANETEDAAVAQGETQELSDAYTEELTRPVEMPSAFFMPDLKANETGIIDINITVPDYNTTWQFQICGYNNDMLNASLTAETVASKKVMAKSNLPQFLRTGDMTEFPALLYNNSPDTIGISGKITVFNPLNGDIIKEEQYEAINVDPSGHRKITLRYEVPDSLNIIGVKTMAYSEGLSDGEQGIVYIYPSHTPLTEATTFYAGASEETVEVILPEFEANSNVTLKYCDNPLWEVLLSLPALRDNADGSSLYTARSLYAVTMTNNIINAYPGIKEGLHNIIMNSEDSTLAESNLTKDESLKIVVLEASPWVNNASEQTSRMRNLSEYFDTEKTQNIINKLIINLGKLQKNDGGWCWFEGMDSSPYITAEIIGILSYLNNNGLLNPDLTSMVRKAIKYYDNRLENFRKKKLDLNTLSTMDYLYSRSSFKLPMSSTIKTIENETCENIIKEWRHWDMGEKAKAALLLYTTSKFKEEADTIKESLKEYTDISRPLYQEAIALELYRITEPESEAVEKLRRNILLSKETEDWSKDPKTVGVIQALVSTNPTDVYTRPMPEIYIDGKVLDLKESQALTGNYTVNLIPEMVSGKKVEIQRESGIPAWGGVVYQYISPIQEVDKVEGENISVEKKLFTVTPSGETIEREDLKVGDKVQVVLGVSCEKDMDYVVLIDSRAACLKSQVQLSGMTVADGIPAYMEVRDNTTTFFIEHLPAGKYVISYDCYVEREGDYSLGTAQIQSLYSPTQTAHSAGNKLTIFSQD